MFVRPWDEASKRIMDQITQNGKAFTKNIDVPRAFGRRYPQLIDNDFLTIAHSSKKKESVFVTKPNVRVMPMPVRASRSVKWAKYKFYKIF